MKNPNLTAAVAAILMATAPLAYAQTSAAPARQQSRG